MCCQIAAVIRLSWQHDPSRELSDARSCFLNDESAATAIEYGLIAAGIALAIIVVVNGLGTNLNTVFASVSSQLN
jgi:pilus assembly protein Flp/PilA